MNETRNNRIRETIDQIEPSQDARERILENIYRKATEQMLAGEGTTGKETVSEAANPVEDVRIFRKAPAKKGMDPRVATALQWAIAIAACLIIVIIGSVKFFPRRTQPTNDPDIKTEGLITAGGQTATPTETDLPGDGQPPEVIYAPIRYESAEALAQDTGLTVAAPADSTNQVYSYVSGNIAQVVFSYKGSQYLYRASKSNDDISGLYGDASEPKQLAGAEGTEYSTVSDDPNYNFKLVWKVADVNYVLTGDATTSEETVVELYRAVTGQ
ncbi:MAG: hypothetical protein J6Y67_04515 [Lachnospiraceae bacterium]|nr:hypothetical protein [Lachnospiraceae bacterium]